MTDRRQRWDERYAARPDTAVRRPNHVVADVVSRWPAGVALDLGGALVVVANARDSSGTRGPRDPALRYTTKELREAATGLRIERCEDIVLEDDDGDSSAVVLVARAG